MQQHATVVSRHRKNFHYFCWSNTPWRKTTGKLLNAIWMNLFSHQTLIQWVHLQKFHCDSCARRQIRSFPCLLLPTTKLVIKWSKRGILPWLKQQENQGSEESPWQCHLLKKRKNHLNKSYPPKQSPILMLLWIMQKTPAALAKNLAMIATIAFSPIGPSTRSGRTCRPWSATCYPRHALRQCKWVTKTARCVVQKAYHLPIRDTVMFRMQPKT